MTREDATSNGSYAKNSDKKDKTSATKSSRDKKKSANRAKHRLLSICYDVEHYLKPLFQEEESGKSCHNFENLPIVANERCGTWYALPFHPHSFCHFKSTDGHVHLFSLKRLNLPFLKTVAKHGSVVILDASNKKEMPDSFSRTLPIWACVVNRIAERYRFDLGMERLFTGDDDLRLYFPIWIVPEEERTTMESIIDMRVEELYQSQAIVDVPNFVATLSKPLRPFWTTPLHSDLPVDDDTRNRFYSIICCNASNLCLGGDDSTSRIVWREEDQFWYTPGAADDHESWARHLTPQLFWKHAQQFSADLTDQQTEDLIDGIVQRATNMEELSTYSSGPESYDWIGKLNVAIGTRRAGRPLDCWGNFDAILNVTNTEYDDMMPSCKQKRDDKFYLQMPVEEGKRDKQELERWLPVGILFCAHHAMHHRRILIHCAQGRDRSVAVAMAVVQLFCTQRYPLEWNMKVLEKTVDAVKSSYSYIEEETIPNDTTVKLVGVTAGLPQDILNSMLGQDGRDVLLAVARQELCLEEEAPMATKESLRIVLHLIRQDREKAEPTRSSMQKLNRFFMSKAFKPPAKNGNDSYKVRK